MLGAKDVAVLDIGSKKIQLFFGSFINGNCRIKAVGSADYSGFSDGSFFNEDEIFPSVKAVISEVESHTGKKIRKIYVGVPGEFSLVETRTVNYSLGGYRSVTDKDLDKILDIAESAFVTDERYLPINSSAIYYDLDSYAKIADPRDMTARDITATVSCVLCEKSFAKLFDSVLARLGVKEAEYVSSCFAEAIYLFDQNMRDRGVALCDIGYLTSSVMVARGDGLLDMLSFSLGGGNLIADFCIVYGIDFSAPDKLFDKINLNLIPNENDVYTVDTLNGYVDFPMKEVHEIAYARLDNIADAVSQCLSDFGGNCPRHLPMFFTGGGVAKVKGAVEYIAHQMGRRYEIVCPNVQKYNKPAYSSAIGLLDFADRLEKNNRNYFVRLAMKLIGRI